MAMDNRLDVEGGDFGRKYGEVLACSGTSTNHGYLVNSALTKTKYIWYDWSTGQYHSEAR